MQPALINASAMLQLEKRRILGRLVLHPGIVEEGLEGSAQLRVAAHHAVEAILGVLAELRIGNVGFDGLVEILLG